SETETADPRRFRYTAFSLYDMNLPIESPLSGIGKDDKPERLMPLGTLLQTAADLAGQNQIVAPYYVEFHKRLSLPAAAVVCVLVGFPLGIRAHRGGRALTLASSFGIVVTYYFFHTELESLALSRRLPAGFAMWLPNVVYGALGVALLRATTTGVST